jgi:hypothetical protein
MTRLDDTQQILWRLITAREGAAGALAALPDAESRLPQGLDGLVRGDERLGAVERVDIYANMYFFRLLECLEEDFPAVAAVVGHEAFHVLAADYLEAHPSEHPSLRMLGRSLGAFLDRHPLRERHCWIADLARFEWALLEAFDAEDVTPVGADRLASVGADEWAGLRLRISPSLRVVEASAPVDEVWRAVTESRPIASPDERATVLCVWREGLQVFHRPLEPVEREALVSASRGAVFANVCEAAATVVGEEDAAAAVARMLTRWLGDGLVAGFEVAS